jgi:peptide/nickel transport system permease protein
MYTYIIRRFIQMFIVLIIVSMIVFFTVRLLPGDPILIYMSRTEMQNISQEQIDAMRHETGLDKPQVVQYGLWMRDVFTGNLGTSLLDRRPVLDSIMVRLPVTLYLGGIAFVISAFLGIVLGIVAAVYRGRIVDVVVTGLGNVGVTTPVFWLGILLIYFFALKLKILPAFGYTSPFEDFWASIQQAILPIFCLIVPRISSILRLTRSSMLDVIHEDYIRTALSKGLRERTVIFKHALKNALIPVFTLTGMQLAGMISGQVLIERVFSIPGIGRMVVEAVLSQDYSVLQGAVLIIGILVLVINLIVDLSWGWIDPRIRYG